MFCTRCGSGNLAGAEICAACGLPLALRGGARAGSAGENVAPISGDGRPSVPIRSVASIGLLVLVVLVALAVIVGVVQLISEPTWEYRVVVFGTESQDRTGSGALRYSSIKVEEKALEVLGAQGWELVGTFLEMETAFPNFGKEEYVTGLQPNVRPQRAVLLLKRSRGFLQRRFWH